MSGENDEFNTKEKIRLAAIKEQASVLSEEIYEDCQKFRNSLKHGQILGYKNKLAKLYYDISYANYKYYKQGLVKNNLLSIKIFLEKCIQQFSNEQKIIDRINIIKDAKYFLDSACDLYLKPSIEQNDLPNIPGNAVVLVATKDHSEYRSYFVENGIWVENMKKELKCIQLQNINHRNLMPDNKSGLVKKTKSNAKEIENITQQAQLKRGRVSINVKYHKLIRKRNQLEQDLEKKVLYARNKKEDRQESSNTEASSGISGLLNSVKNALKTTVQSASNKLGYEIFGIHDLPSVVIKRLETIIEYNLEIGFVDQAEYYINILRNINEENSKDKLNEFNLRKDLIIQLNQILESETDLLLPKEDDIKYFIVKIPEKDSDYNKEIEKWKKNQCKDNNKSILFIYNPNEEQNHRESWFWIPNKIKEILKLNISENSILSQFLKHIYSNKTTNLFFGELLDMLGDKNVFVNLEENLKNILFINDQFILKSRRTKIIDSCEILAKAYEFIGHEPLQERYKRIIDYFSNEKDKFLQQFSSSCELSHHSKNSSNKNPFPLSLFPLYSGSAVRKLNDRINETDFFSDILPYIDQIKDLRRSLNFIYNIDWQFCDNQNNKEKFFQDWYKENNKFNQNNPYERKYLFLLIQCDIHFIEDFDEKNLPKIFGNAIILTKTEDSENYKAYFMKDSIWMKDSRVDVFRNIIVKNIRIVEKPGWIDKDRFEIEEGKNEIEKIITEMKLNRWYFYGEVANGRVSEGFIDEKNELKPLEIYLKNILPNDIKNHNKNKLCNKESQILNHLSEIYKEDNCGISSSSEQYFLKPISKIIYDQQISLNKGIRIYDLRKIDHAKDLKIRIQSDRKKSFSCIVKLSNKHYITLFIENEISDNEHDCFLRYIYILNSTYEKRILKKLKWFTGVSGQCIYKLSFIQCQKQKLMSEDSLLHAYFNASACQWAFNNQHWKFLKKIFHKQIFSSKENIEKLKQWFVESVEDIYISKHIEEEALQQQTFEIIKQFKKIFSKIITSHLNSINVKEISNYVENLGKNFVTIRTFNDIYTCINNNIKLDNPDEIQKCINEIEQTRDKAEEIKREHFEVDTIVNIMFSILKECSLNLLSYQEKLSKNFEYFEDRLHHTILLNIAKTSHLISQKIYPNCATQVNEIFKSFHPDLNNYSHSSYIKFIERFENYLENEKMFSNRDELLLICKNLKQILKTIRTEDIKVKDQLAKKSAGILQNFIERFVKTEDFLKKFHQIFKCLLPYCYELLKIPEINNKLKDNIYKYISYQKQSFDNIESCINGLFNSIKKDESIKASFHTNNPKQIIKYIFSLFKKYIEEKDERAVHYIGVYLREIMMTQIDDYMKSLTEFRHKTLVSIEHFEKELHQFLLNSIRESIKHENANNQLASIAKNKLNSQNNTYDNKISMYINVIEVFRNLIPSEIIQPVELQLKNTKHSHVVYLQTKIDDLTNMLDRFSKVEKLLPKFSKLFRQCLINKYDHLSEEEVFSSNGKMKNEIFNYLKQDKSFNDIKKLLQNFNSSELTNIVEQCEVFVRYNDEKASAEISQCLRQCIIDTVDNYTTSLLTYRHKALVAFNHFEKNLHDLLSTYDAIHSKTIRDSLKQILDEFNKLPNGVNDNYYRRSLEVYRRLVNSNNLNREFEECASVITEILKEDNHTLKPYFKEKINNIKNILNSYINWYQIQTFQQNEYIIYEIRTTSGILSEILKRLKSQYPDCFRPNNEIRILNSNKLHIDTDLSSSDYSGVNIALVSPYQKLIEKKDKLIIITNGENAKDDWKNNPAKSGHSNGENGEDGFDGKAGKSAGHIYIVTNELPKIDVSACGGKGGSGQNGGNGASGLDGKDGNDGDKEAVQKKVSEDRRLYSEWATRSRRKGTDGMPGSSGGDAGSGGFRGDGGNPGLVKLVPLNDISAPVPYKNLPGEPGIDEGEPGQPGEAGKHGRDGLDYVAIGKWGFFSRDIGPIKGGRLRHLSDRKDLDESRFCNNYSMLSFENDEDKDRFKNKYDDIHAHRGADKSRKHKNQETVQKIHAIDCQHIFQVTSQFFGEFNNPQKLSYQHWLAPNLNEFLLKMARLVGLPPSEIYALPDIEHDAKQILIIQQNFTETINTENQRLNFEKIDTKQMSIGIALLGQDILSQYNEFLQQYQIVYQQLQKEIQKIDVNQLTTGLEIRSIDIAKMRNTLNRILNEQRLNQRLIASQRRTDVLIDNSQEKLSKSILDRENIKILHEDIFKRQWKKFPIETNIIQNKILEEFNDKPNEESLLKLNCHFLFQLEMLSQNNIEEEEINRNHISNFTNIYLYNLQQGNFTFKHLKLIENEKQAFFQILPELKSLENTSTLDLLIEFCKGMQREYLRHYWLIWITKTLSYGKNSREKQETLSDLSNKLRAADENQLKQFDNDLKSSFLLLKEFPDYDFDKDLYQDSRLPLIESINKFNNDSNQKILFEIFQIFSNSIFFDKIQKNIFENLIINVEQLNIIQDFFIIFQHNLNLMNIDQNQFDSLIKQIIKIEKILIQYPRSYFHDIIFNFSISIMKINQILIPDKIDQSKDLSKLLTFQTKKTYKRKTTFTVKQQIDAFKTLYDLNLVEEIFQNLSISSDIKNLLEDKELNEFFQWTVDHLNNFDNKTIENILKIVENILRNEENVNLQFLRIVFRYKKTKLDIEKQKKEIELNNIEKENFLKEFLSIVNKCNRLFSKISENNEIPCEIYTNLIEINNFTEFTDFRKVSDEILCETRTVCADLLNNLSRNDRTERIHRILRTLRNQMSEEKKQIVDQSRKNIEKTVEYLKDKIEKIDEQQNILRSFIEKKDLLDISDKLFSNIQNLDYNIRTLIVNKLNSKIPSKQLYFCIFMKEIYQKIEDFLFYLKNNDTIKLSFEKEFENFFDKQRQSKTIEQILSDLASPFIDILNLYQFNFDENIGDSFSKTIEELKNIKDEKILMNLKEKVLIDLMNSYPLFKNELKSIKIYIEKFSSIEGKQIKNYEIILTFLYGELNEKSNYVDNIYKEFFKSLSNLQKKPNFFDNFIGLVKLINKTHRDILCIDVNDINNAQFQVILLHILFEKGHPLGNINEEFIDFLAWLFETLSTYESIENIENVKIEIDHIEQLKQLTGKIEDLYKNKSNDNSDQYQFLNTSISSIYQGMKSIYIQKYMKIISEKYSDAKWLGVVIYFPEYFIEDINNILDLIPRAPDLVTDNGLNKIQDIIIQRVRLVQETKLEKFFRLIIKNEHNEHSKFKNQLENVFEGLKGYLKKKENCDSCKKINPYYVLNLYSLLDTFNDRLETDGGLVIQPNIFIKIQKCLCCFEDIRLAIEKLSSSSQNEWLKIVLVEHILEKFCLIFPNEKEIEDIRNILMQISEKLLLLFNNVFITQYSDQIGQAIYSNDNPIPEYQKMNKEKFVTIANLLRKIPSTKDILDQLSDASLSVWDTLLNEMEFSQIFKREMLNLGIDLNTDGIEKALLFLNRIRVKLGIENNDQFLDFFQNISKKISEIKVEKSIEQLNKLLQAIHYQEISFEEAFKIISENAYEKWQEEIEKLKGRYLNTDISDRSADEIIKQMKEEQKNSTNVISKENLDKIAKETKDYREKAKKINVLEGDEISYINQNIQNIFDLSSYQNDPEEYIRSHVNDIIPLILYAWSIANKSQFPKDTQIIALLLFIYSKDKGLLEQVRTGEGKTLIVGISAAFFALCGYAVNIVSSNRDLAIDGEKKCHSFFQLLKLESGHICSEDDDVNHQSYRPDLNTPQGNIIYGEVGSFQRDILEVQFNNKKIFGDHYLNRKKCLIVDEADNMCLDKARHVLYLSHEIQCLKWLETLFIFIWTAVNSKKIENSNEISQDIEDISQYIKQLVDNKHIFIPDYMKEFVTYKIKRWVDSAFQARIMREDDHFVLDISKADEHRNKKQKTIIVLDKDTGVEQYSTRWSHGLAQFLELKYRRKLTVESLKAVFISNKAFFQRYDKYLYGLTGTLGSENSQKFLSDLYQLQFAYLPTSKKKYFHQIDNKISIEYGDWLNLIAKETIEQAKKRPVLIICENVESTENIWNELIRHSVPHHTITKYRRDGDNVEEKFQKKPATIGDIIIATNKGGRGTDIHVDPQVNKDKGMHVILSYLPENIRVEEQAFGRTGRNGAQGTGQFILLVDKSIYEEMYDLNQYTNEQKQSKLESLADVIIEKEKNLRDNKEAARLSELKQKNILHLEVEEELFKKFNEFKNEISKDVFKPLFEDKSEKFQEKYIDAFENILKNRWAFWLDEAKDKIDAIENFQQKFNLLKEFDSSFIEKLKECLRESSFDNLLNKFIKQPEEAIHIGKVCLSENDISKAKLCFEKGIKCGDISGFSHIALAYCIITLKEGEKEDIKKQSRKELKQALYSLELIKRNLMSNLKIAELLPQSATADIFQKVSSKENFYQDQIIGKLEVIGLQLHYLRQAIGDTIEPSDFILYAKDRQNITEQESAAGEKLYNLLVDGGLISGDRIRKRFKKNSQERDKIIQDNIDPSIADELIKLLNRQETYKTTDFEKIVCYNEELWGKLGIKECEEVHILHKQRIKRELPEKFENIWKELEEKIKVQEVDVSLFENSTEKKNFKTYLEKKKILIRTKRVKIIELNLESLNFENTDKYSKIKFNDNGDETKDLKTFLIELIENIQESSEYLYQTDLPFSTKEEEGNKIRIFLKEKNILKSGGLAMHKYGNKSNDIEKKLKDILKDPDYISDINLILSKILNLQGSIRSYEDDLKANLRDFIDLKGQEIVPSELKFFEGFGLDKFIIIEEDKSWWDWRAFAVAMIGLAQVIAGAILISFGLVNIGGALITEGISDMIYATMAGLSGNFSWKDWAIQKAISLSLSIMSAGFGRLASVGGTAAKLGSVSRAAMIAKIVGKASLQFATTCLTNIITEKIMEQVQDGVIQNVVNYIEKNFLKGINESIRKKVELLYANNKNDKKAFEESFSEIRKHIEGALGRNLILPQQFDNIRVQVISSLQNSYQVLVEGLKKSNSKYAKIAATTIQATLMINKLWSLVGSILQFNHAYNTLQSIIEGATSKIGENSNREDMNDELIKVRADELNNIIKGHITSKLTRELDRVIRQIVSGTLNRLGKAIGQIAKDMINSEFNGKNPVDVLKQSNQKENQVSVEQPLTTDKSKNEKEEQDKRESLQNDVKNLKNLPGYSSDEVTNKDRALGFTDLKMLAQKDARNIVVYNTDTGEKEVIRPSGLNKVFAFFKQSAKINYKAGENGDIGHYSTARGKETYIQINGRNDCLLIAYHESLGRKVDENTIQQERDKLYRYIGQNRKEFERIKQERDRSGRDALIGGKHKRRTTTTEESVAPIKRGKKQTTPPESDGTYGTRNSEKRRLNQEEGVKITGQTHESEHVIPYRIISGNLISESIIPRDSPKGRKIEGSGAAYYEQTPVHKRHPGTGSGARPTAYCNTIDYALRVEQNPSIALQLATSEYASNPAFAENAHTPAGRAANNSYLHMLRKTDSVNLRNPDGTTTKIEVLNIHREEAYTARFAAEKKRCPTDVEQKEIYKKVRLRQKYGHLAKRQN